MLGAIRKRDILAHLMVTVQCFGWKVFLRTLAAGPNETFLDIVAGHAWSNRSPPAVPELVERGKSLERCAMRIYAALANQFGREEAIRAFFEELSYQEHCHAQLLELCNAPGSQDRWIHHELEGWRSVVERLEQNMREFELRAAGIDRTLDAFRLVIDIESSEIDDLLLGVVQASNSPFMKAVSRFLNAEEHHIAFICRNIRELEPSLEGACRELLEQHRPASNSGAS